MKSAFMMVAVALMALAAPARAQSGFFVGAQITGASLDYKDAAQKLDFGQGFGVHAGLSIGSSLGVLVNYDKNTLGQPGGHTDLGQYDLLGRLNFIGIGPVKTYILGGITGRVAKSPNYNGIAGNYDFSGKNPTAGVSASVFPFKSLSVNGTMLWTFGKFNDTGGYSTSRVEATGSRVSVGVSWYVLGGR
jgi:hypothetical protein